ncbi:GGDEF domain-containing protein [Uliginosibacterium sp. H3]|uniref:diguanylate cyclase n=1 Tax=Uliginosibacterium silvisoli TaxID=3114758 RepID=A0ABU6K052_9RHOO|nr:GGDEF domain-containing protein [Uliginosibacterium sp. H3]
MNNDDMETRVTSLKSPLSGPGEDCLVIIHSPIASELGRRYVLDIPSVKIGRDVDNDIVTQSDGVSRKHARIERRGSELILQDLNSTNGTFANNDVQRVTVRSLMPGDQIHIGDTVFKFLAGTDIEAQYHAAINRAAITDGLTGLANRKRIDTLLGEEIPRAQRYGRALSLLMLDVDHFKRVNDTHGHLAGDAVLRQIATLLRQRLRPSDEPGRYGGEEFCVILPETAIDQAALIAESIRSLIESHSFVIDTGTLRATVSIGIATLGSAMRAEDLYNAADQMLYQAKHGGRNRVSY